MSDAHLFDSEWLHDQIRREIMQATPGTRTNPAQLPTGIVVINLPIEQRPAMFRCLLAAIRSFHQQRPVPVENYLSFFVLSKLLAKTLRSKLPLVDEDIVNLIKFSTINYWHHTALSATTVLRTIECFAARQPLSDAAKNALKKYRDMEEDSYYKLFHDKKYAIFLQRIDIILGGERQLFTSTPLTIAEPWAAAAQKDIDTLPRDAQQTWTKLLQHLQTVEGSKPTKKWLSETSALIETLGRDRFRTFLTSWFTLTPEKRNDCPSPNGRYDTDENLLFSDVSRVTLKGLAWAASLFNEPEVASALGDLGETCWKKIVNYGPRSKLAGNAVFWALSAIGTNAAIAQLTRINARLKHASARKLADKAINRVAESSGQTREDLEELALSTFNFDKNGVFTQNIGNFCFTLAIDPNFDVDLTITDSKGKIRKSIPADVKTTHATEIKAMQRMQKELRALLPAQRLRIESILRFPDRHWSFAAWRTRYIEHPLLSTFARRLIWTFTTNGNTTSAIYHNNQFLVAGGSCAKSLNVQDANIQTTVRLWHPCTNTPETVRAWRDFLEKNQIIQPFKQAHREVYLLTDAERNTGAYSNRFAAHIIRQHQFNALCAHRGWKYKLQGSWDGGSPIPTLDLKTLNIKAEFWVEIVPENIHAGGTGVASNLSTDQVRFYQLESPEQLRLDQVPAQVFSEIMRDVDLFIGVCSVGNDPTWSDGGPEGRYRNYWNTISFGDLSAQAETRKEILSKLLPRLSIAGQCSLTDKFLHVEGSLRTYKIHLGSANILMEPNDQYLCIVPDHSFKNLSVSKLYLPFEGDSTLAVIISKAFLLAEDKKITDPTILQQIRL